MAHVLSLLPALACPLIMGLMMWLMMRGNTDRSADQAHQIPLSSTSQPTTGERNSAPGGFRICFNWKVIVGLAAVGVGIWVAAPNLVWAALPALVVLACPLSMLFMMRGMGGDKCAAQPEQEQAQVADHGSPAEQLVDLRARHAAITCEITELEAANEATSRPVEATPGTHGISIPRRS